MKLKLMRCVAFKVVLKFWVMEIILLLKNDHSEAKGTFFNQIFRLNIFPHIRTFWSTKTFLWMVIKGLSWNEVWGKQSLSTSGLAELNSGQALSRHRENRAGTALRFSASGSHWIELCQIEELFITWANIPQGSDFNQHIVPFKLLSTICGEMTL